MNTSPLLLFSQTIAGKFTNIAQAQQNPRDFAHINIYFRPIKWSILEGPWFYSEQSYDYAPWSPYRQGVHRLLKMGSIIVVENYALKSPERFAGSGFMPELLEDLKQSSFAQRIGCSMHFKEIKPGHYMGQIEAGKNCLLKNGNNITYVVSYVEFNSSNWISLDKGMDINTNKRVWGSEYGPIKFKKIEVFDSPLAGQWLLLDD